MKSPKFERYIGIDYSGAEVATASLKGLRVYTGDRSAPPVEVPPPPSPRKDWSRREIALWLVDRLSEDRPTIVGIDHGFSFPMAYFEKYGVPHGWPAFLDDFQAHWPTDEDNTYVDFIRDGAVGNGAARAGMTRWKRLTEKRAGSAKSLFHFDVQGSVAKSTHSGLPWLRFLRQKVTRPVHFWPFDGWEIPTGSSAGKALKVAAGDTTQYALLDDGTGEKGTIVSWGTNDEGQLGNGPMGATGELGRYPKPSITPVRVTGLTDIIQIEAGAKHAVALRKDGTVWAWGTRDNGWTPAEVTGLDRMVAVAAGSASFAGNAFSGAVRDDGSVWEWGSGVAGVMGNGTRNPSPDDPCGRNLLPLQVQGLANVKTLSLGYGHAAALLGDGTLRMWGFDGFGQIGVGTSAGYYPKPVMVKGITNVASVYLGGNRSFALRADGTLWIWGYASSGGQGILGKNLHVPTLLELP